MDKKINNNRIAVVFPGIGYHGDKPLLYYSARMARLEYGYEIVTVKYSEYKDGNIKGDPAKMKEAAELYLEDAVRCLKEAGVEEQRTVRTLFLAKSIGTVVAGACAQKMGINAGCVYYTPLAETFQAAEQGSGIAFHGTADPWAETEQIRRLAEEKNIPLYITEGANHSLETGDTLTDIRNLEKIMNITKNYMEDYTV